jgi:serine phosphatase RsbU (regulator of sigma subunit)
LRYANCGHLSALVLRCDGALEQLEATCTVIGLFEEWRCSITESRLNAGDVLLLYTDGVTESFNSQEEDFGEQRLMDALRSHSTLPATQLAGAIVEEVLLFSGREQYDDITLIVAKRVDAQEQGPC